MFFQLQNPLKILVALFMICSVSLYSQDVEDEVGSFNFDGHERNYEVYLPQNFQPNLPMVISLHEYGKNIQDHKEYTLLHQTADSMGFIIAYPQALLPAWNTGVVDPERKFSTVNDVGFISALIDTIHIRYNIDLKRVYVCGFGTGGEMALRLGLDLGHRFAAIASVSGKLFDYPYPHKTQTFHPLPLVQIHGTGDWYSPYYETRGTMWTVPQTLNFWAKQNNCLLQADTTSMPDIDPDDGCTVDKIIYKDCDNNAKIIHYKVLGGGSQWPGAPYILDPLENRGKLTSDINANIEILSFFNNFENLIPDLAFAKSKQVYPHFISPTSDTLIITSNVSNPDNHPVTVSALIKGTSSTFSDTLQLFDDGEHNDGQALDNIWGTTKWLSNLEPDIYDVSLSSIDLQLQMTTRLVHPTKFTNLGPIDLDSLRYRYFNPENGTQRFSLVLKNLDNSHLAEDISIRVKIYDPRVEKINISTAFVGDIQANATGASGVLEFEYKEPYDPEDIPKQDPIIADLTIFSNNSHFWSDTFSIYSANSPVVLNVPNDFSTIQKAIDAAKDGNVVLVDEGVYYENINFKGKTITVASNFFLDGDTCHISKTIIDGSQNTDPDSGSVVSFISGEDTTSVLTGFTITGGSGTKTDWLNNTLVCGGGIYGYGGTATIKNNRITGNNINASGGGGGIIFIDTVHTYAIVENNSIEFNSVNGPDFAAGGGVKFWNCSGRINSNSISNNSVISENVEAEGGGIFLKRDRPLTPVVYVEKNTISNNYCGGKDVGEEPGAQGGGLHSQGVSAMIKSNVITYNKLLGSGFSGGAGILIGDMNDITRIEANEIAFNKVLEGPGNGGGLSIHNSQPLIVNNIIHNNEAENGAGFFMWSAADATLINNTIVYNKGSSEGAGIFVTNSAPVILNTIIWQNEKGLMQVFQENSIKDLTIAYSNIQFGWEGDENVDSQPFFADARNYDFNLMKDSPGIGWGVDSIVLSGKTYTCPASDFYGNIRPNPIDAGVDMGAIESDYITDIENKTDPLPTKFTLKQNFPNPFNPITTIEYQLPKTSKVNLSVYNLLGQKVETLVSEKQVAGGYKVEWDASDFASGIYLYKLKTDKGYEKTRKLVLVK